MRGSVGMAQEFIGGVKLLVISFVCCLLVSSSPFFLCWEWCVRVVDVFGIASWRGMDCVGGDCFEGVR